MSTQSSLDTKEFAQFREALVYCLKKNNWSQGQLAAEGNTSQSLISEIISGKKGASLRLQSQIAKTFGYDYDKFLDLGRRLLAGENIAEISANLPGLRFVGQGRTAATVAHAVEVKSDVDHAPALDSLVDPTPAKGEVVEYPSPQRFRQLFLEYFDQLTEPLQNVVVRRYTDFDPNFRGYIQLAPERGAAYVAAS